jgi:phasin family protein
LPAVVDQEIDLDARPLADAEWGEITAFDAAWEHAQARFRADSLLRVHFGRPSLFAAVQQIPLAFEEMPPTLTVLHRSKFAASPPRKTRSMMNTANFADAGKASSEKMFGMTSQAFAGVEQFAALNIQAGKTMLAEGAQSCNALLAAKSPDEFMKVQSDTLQGAPEKAAAYARQVNAIFTAAAASLRTSFDGYFADMQSRFVGAVEGALKDVPGSEQAKALVKSAVDAANNVYEGVNKASRDVAEAAEANVGKVAELATSSSRSARAAVEA